MNWTQMIEEVASQTGLPKSQVHKTLSALSEVALSELSRGEDVVLRNIGTVTPKKVSGRTIRSISDNRRMHISERFAVKFRPAAAARRAVAELLPQHWKDPRHQAAWRAAETLIADLNLYHSAKAPKTLTTESDDATVRAACASAFGSQWADAISTYDKRVEAEVRETCDYLAQSARRRWASE